ncbi:acetyl-CoA hydrolase/transferase C-terminal domain-containing protein [Cryptosporangium sp. NPDC051539]|uniref:acetyl-CoA hydrolase/transferase C-terminal domain-containing protein n=1 Tax=Cryptosporangium sp. NPDC051539 TaxID=3363962 RepID=UPI0037A4FD48
MTAELERGLAALLRPGTRVALGDGCGTPRAAHGALGRAATGRDVGLLLGWMPVLAPELDPAAFADVRVLLGGPGARAIVESGAAHAVPARLSALPALLAGPLRPDLLVATVVRRPDGWHFAAEVSYLRGLVTAGVPVAAVVSTAAPCADAGPALPDEAVTVVGETDELPAELPVPRPTETDVRIARRVAPLVPEGARLQIGPGRLARAIVAEMRVPVRVDSGQLPDSVLDLDARGLLLGEPVATYLAGSRALYDWADGRPILRPVEETHDIGRLAAPGAPPLIAVNLALEMDLDGQVNVEGIGGAALGMIGGHPDFAAAGVRGPGLSVIALPSRHATGSTLVERLSRPVTTASHDVEVVVTEHGIADLRGLDRGERRRALRGLWEGATGRRSGSPGGSIEP